MRTELDWTICPTFVQVYPETRVSEDSIANICIIIVTNPGNRFQKISVIAKLYFGKTSKLMAKPNLKLINALNKTANKLKAGAPYQWGHMGSCNCGSLAQEIAHISKSDIHEYAMRSAGSWEEQSFAYCPTSGYPMDLLITTMLDAGLELIDLKHLEKLTDPAILKRLPKANRHLKHNVRDDVVVYLKTWAGMLEESLIDAVELVPFYTEPSPQVVGK